MGAEQTAADVFGLLSDETRIDILRTVAHAQYEERQTGVTELSFSDIYDRVDVDSTSKLSYHVGELTGTFLRKHENGYAFTHAGEQLVRFILSENYRDPPAFGTIETRGNCLFCGGSPLEAQLEDQYFLIRCAECNRPAFSYRIRPAQARSHSGHELIEAIIWEQVGDFLKMQQGVCPECAGQFQTEVMDAAEAGVGDLVPVSFGMINECDQCRRVMGIPLPYAAAYHPESIAFHWEHDIDILGTGVWEFNHYLQDGQWTTDRIQADPDEYQVELQQETGALRLYLDEHAAVTRTERVRHSDRRGGRL